MTFTVEGHKSFNLQLKGVDVATQVDKKKEKLKMAHKILKVKDKYRISYKALQALRSEAGLSNIPSEKYLNRESLRLATSLQIIPLRRIPSKDGCTRQVSEVIQFILDLPENRPILQQENPIKILLRFACDGAKLTKTKNAVRGVIKLIPPLELGRYTRTASPDDEMTVFLYMGKEDRAFLDMASKSTFNQMMEIARDGLMVQGKMVKVQWIVSSDWKALALLKGVNAANAKFFCAWCHASKDDITNFMLNWTVERSAQQEVECLKPDAQEKFGYQAKDLLPWIPYEGVVPDELHLRIRITSKLLNQVVMWAVDQDRAQALEAEMQDNLKLDFQFYQDQGDDGKGCIKK